MPMTLENTVLQKLAEWPPASGRRTLNLPAEGSWAVAVTADRHDELGCLLWELNLHRGGPAPAGSTLSAWAERVAGRATGLLEPLKVVEVDAERGEALLRSDQPTQRGEKLYYYEVLLKNTKAALVRRFQALPGNGRRDQVPFALTNEVLAKFVADLAADQ
jgi:hypothetical protein